MIRYFLFSALFAVHVAALSICDRALPPSSLPTASWNHFRNVIFSLGSPHHSANDVIVALGKDAVIPGKFSYGPTQKDISDERIELWIDDCQGGLRKLGVDVTDHDGRINFRVPASLLTAVGQYQIYERVVADGTMTELKLRVVAPESRVVIFDLDGTLTLSDREEFLEVMDPFGLYLARSRRGASELTHLWKNRGCEIIYLSSRHYSLTHVSRRGISAAKYAPGTVLVSHGIREWIMDSAKFKLAELQKIVDSSLVIEAAYGNSVTDIEAYEQIGIPKNRIFITGDKGGYRDTQSVGEDFLKHLIDLTAGIT